MAHIHGVYDNDTHFEINPTTRAVKNTTEKKNLVQFDHNSERFTFEIPRFVEDHDMTLCDKVEIHYINVSGNSQEKSVDVYLVDDLQPSLADDSVAIFSWLISANATKYAGTLNFLIRFVCLDGETIEYAWNTAIFQSITIAGGMDNGESVIAASSDVLEAWRKEVLTEAEAAAAEAATAASQAGEAAEEAATALGEMKEVFVTPQMFGAKAEYDVDDADAIQAAIDSGKPIRFPKGTYTIKSPLVFQDKHNYVFDAEDAIIEYYGTDYAIYMRYVTNSTFRFGLLRARSGGGGGCIHLYAENSSEDFCQYVNIYFQTINATTNGIFAEQKGGSWINDVRLFNGRLMHGDCGVYLKQAPTGDGGIGNWRFDHVGFEGITTGVHFATGGAEMKRFYFSGCRNEESMTTFMYSDGAVNAIEYSGCSPLRESILNLAYGSDGRVHTQIISATGGLLGHSANIVNGRLVRQDSTRYQNFGNSHPDTFIDLRTFGSLECPTFILSGGSSIDTLILPNYFGCIGGINKFFFRFAYATSGGTYKVKNSNESTIKEISVNNAFTNIRAEWYESTGWTFFKETGA